ncbi:MAG: anion transporter [candidate division Zixibacteria bacterium]|nr:anion transporter [candidate division Zixibacteria bacterium]
MSISIIVIIAVFVAIAIRQFGRVRLPIWLIMLTGAVIVLLTGQISPRDAIKAINFDVMIFLFGMFISGRALEESGYLEYLSSRFFRGTKSVDSLILKIIFGFGLTSAILMNDTVAIIGTPIIIYLSKRHEIDSRLLLLALAYAITLGSVISPIGNPQNLLIALGGGINNPFIMFLLYLLLPTAVNMILAWLLLKYYYREQFHELSNTESTESIKDPELTKLSRLALALMLAMIAAKILFSLSGARIDFKLTYIAILAAAPIVLLSPKRFEIIKAIDWSTLIFFAAMFVVMAAVWDSGYIQLFLLEQSVDLNSSIGILLFSVLASQIISNVPLVALILPILVQRQTGLVNLMALASGSTIAGNFLILGAASNVIIIQNAENRSNHTLTFMEFARVGIPLTAINILVYWAAFKIATIF